MDFTKSRASRVQRNGHELVITRIFNMSRELVWKAWTDPEHIRRWWGPKEYLPSICKNDFWVGGRYLFCTRSPEGKECWNTGIYREIVPFERIVYTELFCDADGNIVSPTNFGLSPDFPTETLLMVIFEDLGNRTRFTLRQVHILLEADKKLVQRLWNESFDRLSESREYL